MPIYEAAEYVTVEQITPEEQAAGEEPIPAEYIGNHKYRHMPMMIQFLRNLHYIYDDRASLKQQALNKRHGMHNLLYFGIIKW